MKLFSRFSVLIVFFSVLNVNRLHAQNEGVEEYRMKLVLIQKAVENVEWPLVGADSLNLPPFVFGVFGDLQPFGEDLQNIQKRGQLKGRPVKVAFFDNVDALKGAQPDLLFIPNEYSKQVKPVAEALGNKPVLIVSEKYNMVDQGALLVFYYYDESMHCQLNLNAFRARNMVPSVDLIQLGER